LNPDKKAVRQVQAITNSFRKVAAGDMTAAEGSAACAADSKTCALPDSLGESSDQTKPKATHAQATAPTEKQSEGAVSVAEAKHGRNPAAASAESDKPVTCNGGLTEINDIAKRVAATPGFNPNENKNKDDFARRFASEVRKRVSSQCLASASWLELLLAAELKLRVNACRCLNKNAVEKVNEEYPDLVSKDSSACGPSIEQGKCGDTLRDYVSYSGMLELLRKEPLKMKGTEFENEITGIDH
jgi:hypothetical protein